MPAALSHATRIIHAPIGQVWGIVASFGGESLWFPNVTKSSLEGFGVGSVRSLWFGNGPTGKDNWDESPVREKLVSADPATHSLRWQIFNENISNFESFSDLKVRSIDANTAEIVWSGETDFPDGAERDNLKVFIEDMYKTAMEAIAKKLET
ncbi:hypothetical protein DER44DRAFT_806610 [Fusarium oxysporum]|nr:hypothetical protein DER44DRAFT_806610 [Fusarium oxysporum]